MRAAHITQYGDPEEALEIVDVERPEPGAGEVRVDVKAVALNHLDVFARKGHPEDEGEFPKRSGCDISGVVGAVGDGVDPDRVGDEVVVYPGVSCGDCEFCERGEQTMPRVRNYRRRPSRRAGRVGCRPSGLSRCQARVAGRRDGSGRPYHVHDGVADGRRGGRTPPAETALILGASGGVGNAALQIAERLGATTYATTSTAEKAERVREWADEVIDYTETPHDEAVMDLTDGRGVDLVAEHVGQETWQESINSLAMGGRMVVCGATRARTPISTSGRSISATGRSAARRWGTAPSSATCCRWWPEANSSHRSTGYSPRTDRGGSPGD